MNTCFDSCVQGKELSAVSFDECVLLDIAILHQINNGI
jgi:hypothetical protein